jgi:hypothetical protein
MNLQIHFLYIYIWINNLINVYKFQCPLKFEKFISLEHQFNEIRLHAWCHKIRVSQQVQWPMSQLNCQQALGKT